MTQNDTDDAKSLDELWADYTTARSLADDARDAVADAVRQALADGASELGLSKRLGCSRTVIRDMAGKRQRYKGLA